MKNIEDARKEISEIDREIASLFVRRMKAVKAVAEYKKERGLPIFDAVQEERVIARNEGYIDEVDNKNIQTFKTQWFEYFKQNCIKLEEKLNAGNKLEDADKEELKKHLTAFKETVFQA